MLIWPLDYLHATNEKHSSCSMYGSATACDKHPVADVFQGMQYVFEGMEYQRWAVCSRHLIQFETHPSRPF